MKIKTYEAPTEKEAIEKVKQDLGSTAIILTIKKITPKGIFKFFRKEKVEVQAAMDEGILKSDKKAKEASEASDAKDTPKPEAKPSYTPNSSEHLIKDVKISEQEVKIKELEQMLFNNEEALKRIAAQLAETSKPMDKSAEESKYTNATLQIFHDTLVKNGVKNDIAFSLLSDLDIYFSDDDTDVNMIVKLVYNRIIQKLGEPVPIKLEEGSLKVAVFMGSTGVGKTTTIAKLASKLILSGKKRVGLVTSDTYRIAAVEQLKTYGDILGIDVEVIYTPDDLKIILNKIKKFKDIIFFDTAGRSHKNEENLRELKELLNIIPEAELYLVVSSTTKYEDLKVIADTYAALGDYSIIFTKLDETNNLGFALNLCCETGKRLSYLTDGQNVPEDIKIAEPEVVARALLGSLED